MKVHLSMMKVHKSMMKALTFKNNESTFIKV